MHITFRLSHWTWACWWPAPSTGVSLRSASRSSWRRSSRTMTSSWYALYSMPFVQSALLLCSCTRIRQKNLRNLRALFPPPHSLSKHLLLKQFAFVMLFFCTVASPSLFTTVCSFQYSHMSASACVSVHASALFQKSDKSKLSAPISIEYTRHLR